jgi:hypothetical protein
MKLQRYCVTVMDNWTPTLTFWTLKGARKYCEGFVAGAHLYQWIEGNGWLELDPPS